ncbi:hypothetical protein BJ508DRAFT_52623 [Ascobolus immersus RN42]|uniref:Uncharacterized protein n=1 Tax=Ascobolus immersus RN42 TaxID=1160509 RepID=A0A3N4IIA1_ASCIM|nr:hypothetical protein BJ508DRAFT_52623 [Ascobolus immersus RN42]
MDDHDHDAEPELFCHYDDCERSDSHLIPFPESVNSERWKEKHLRFDTDAGDDSNFIYLAIITAPVKASEAYIYGKVSSLASPADGHEEDFNRMVEEWLEAAPKNVFKSAKDADNSSSGLSSESYVYIPVRIRASPTDHTTPAMVGHVHRVTVVKNLQERHYHFGCFAIAVSEKQIPGWEDSEDLTLETVHEEWLGIRDFKLSAWRGSSPLPPFLQSLDAREILIYFNDEDCKMRKLEKNDDGCTESEIMPLVLYADQWTPSQRRLPVAGRSRMGTSKSSLIRSWGI